MESIMKQGYLMYCRKSSEGEERQAESIPAQLEILKEVARKNEYVVLKAFTESKSAKEPGRSEFNKMTSLIDKKGAKGILCWDTSRLFRNPVDEGKIRWLLDTGKIEKVVTPYKTYTKEDSGLIMAIEGGKNHSFIQDLKRNTKRGIDRKIQKGVFPGLAPAGYKNDKHLRQGEKTISPHPVYFDLLREIFTLALTGNFSVIQLHNIAIKKGITNSRGKPISRTQMYIILTNPFYKGDFVYAGKQHPGSHKSMVSIEEFDLLQVILNQKSRPRGEKHEWSFSGLLKCGFCGRQITFERHVKKSGLVFYYGRCTGKYRNNCPQVYVSLKKLERQAYDYLNKIRLSSLYVKWAIKVLKRATDNEKKAYEEKYKTLRKEHDEIKEKLYNLQMKWATTNMIDETVFNRGTEELKSRRKKIYQMLKKEDKNFDETTDLTVETFKFARDAQRKWDEGDHTYKKGILNVISASLVLNKKGRLEIKPRTPFLLIEKAVKTEAKVQPTSKYQFARLNQEIEPKLGSEVFEHSVLGE